VRIKHWLNRNSIKLYDKAYTAEGSVLRAEMTMNEARDFRTYRRKEGDPTGPRQWRVLRKGMADLRSRAQISEQANRRYLDALAGANDELRLEQAVQALERPVRWKRRGVRALHPFATEDLALLRAVSDPALSILAFKNSDLRLRLSPPTPLGEKRQRQAAAVGRKIRLLRAHGIVRKLPGTQRYRLTESGRAAITAILSAQKLPLSHLLQRAA
jgi:DNA-binding MarR family transcriptional regulator